MITATAAEIISVGTELLLGDIINTDAAYLSRALAMLGISVYRQSVVGDNRERILSELDSAFSRCDTVFLTGGLGPTCDDITRECTAEYFGLSLLFNDEAMEHIRQYMADLGRITVTENNRRQAMVPEGADVFINSAGTAPGLAVHGIGRDGREKLAILMPGPPSEFERMAEEHVIPYLSRRSGKVLVSRNIHMYGIGESSAETLLRDFMDQENPTVAPYCDPGEVRIRVTAAAATEEEAEAMCQRTVDEIKLTDAGRYVYAVLDRVIPGKGTAAARVLVEELKEHGLTVAFAESCTGGLASKLVSDVAGSSAVLCGSAVTYAVSSKKAVLGVSDETIRELGVYSEECAREMAEGARRLYSADIAVSVTGVAGPGDDGDTPCGHVCIGVASERGVRSVAVEFGRKRSRDTIRTLAAGRMIHEALDEARLLK
ncbi:MAG: competence/damage-inducible protein A [Ruminococcaceae bacterium]|nr:competence/damage-inducible protein A [Oscillospiraceae bacterium]